MNDGIIKETGNSRLMRAALPDTYEEFKALAAAGKLPLDVLFNAAGWSQLPTFLNKATLLSDTTAEMLGGCGTPDEALATLKELVDGMAVIENGSYVATGTSGVYSPNSLTFPFQPDFWGIYARQSYLSTSESPVVVEQLTAFFPWGINAPTHGGDGSLNITYSGNTVTWYASNAYLQFNATSDRGPVSYFWFAIRSSENFDAGVGRVKPSNENLLDNWYFLDPVNQRGQTEYSGVGYTIDRWKLLNTTDCLIVGEGGLTIKKMGDAPWVLATYFETLPSGPVTVSMLTTTGTHAFYFANGFDNSSQIDEETGVWVNPDVKAILIYSVGAELNITAVKLELGEHQTLAHQEAGGRWVLNDPPPNKALELAKCQRYQTEVANTSGGFIGIGTAPGVADCKVIVPLPTTMRTRPAITYKGSYTLYQAGGTTAVNVTGLYFNAHSQNAVGIGVTVEGGLTIGETYKLYSGNRASLLLEANL